jgi:zinc D-Ala-D-Ala dipeptidase
MAGKRRNMISPFNRRDVVLALSVLPIAAACTPTRPDKDVPFVAAPKKSAAGAGQQPSRLLELIKLDPSIKLDMRYATANNFTGKVLYDEARAFLAPDAANALVRAHKKAQADGYGLTIFDAYRPWRVTKKLWDATPRGPKKNYVANPKKGSKHNRGCAIDLSLHDLKSGALVQMPSGYDDFSEKAHRDYMGAGEPANANRARLQNYMEAEGFISLSNEWWHFDYKDWPNYPILDLPFSDL